MGFLVTLLISEIPIVLSGKRKKGGFSLQHTQRLFLFLFLFLSIIGSTNLHFIDFRIIAHFFLSIDDGAIAMPVRDCSPIALELKHSNQVKPRVKPSHRYALT